MTSQTCDRVDVARAAGDGARSVPGAPPLRFGNHPASATERVLGQALRHAGKLAVRDWKFDATDLVHTRFHGRPLDRKTFNDSENCVANAPLRFDKTNARDFEADPEEAVCWMLVRPCENAHRLGWTVQGFDAFNDWFYEHVVSI
ncbi:hypothetical protein [Paraburkholderia hospita]|uniref:hypothetical protein n=1 Tax=Paraburkholderia hospita TaxID=169430 RepID=UPI0008A731A5|nr:hypothetical protein [Paraburkholderia hospita]SEI22751.1 hypothetical protein SAMN05192544_104470 [Paraburkholderia hospita]